MKKLALSIAIAVLGTATQAAAQDRPTCGTIEMSLLMCETTPCPAGAFRLKTASGFKLELLATPGSAIENQIVEASRYPTKRYCVQGTLRSRSALEVTTIEPEATHPAGETQETRTQSNQ